MIAIRIVLYGVLSGLFGLSAFILYGLRAGERGDALALKPWLVVSAILGLLLSTVALALLAASMAATPPGPINRDAIGMLLSGSATGTAWEARMVALLVAALAALVATGVFSASAWSRSPRGSRSRRWPGPFERSIASGDHAGALGALRRSLGVETACVMSILPLVAWLGTLEAPATAM